MRQYWSDSLVDLLLSSRLTDAEAGLTIRHILAPDKYPAPESTALACELVLSDTDRLREAIDGRRAYDRDFKRKARVYHQPPQSPKALEPPKKVGDVKPLEDYGALFDLNTDPLTLAERVTKCKSKFSRNTWKRQLERIGADAFRAELASLYGDLRSGEAVRDIAAAFTARLKKL